MSFRWLGEKFNEKILIHGVSVSENRVKCSNTTSSFVSSIYTHLRTAFECSLCYMRPHLPYFFLKYQVFLPPEPINRLMATSPEKFLFVLSKDLSYSYVLIRVKNFFDKNDVFSYFISKFHYFS